MYVIIYLQKCLYGTRDHCSVYTEDISTQSESSKESSFSLELFETSLEKSSLAAATSAALGALFTTLCGLWGAS